MPATFYLPLHGGDEYTVPILIDWTASGPRLLDIFCGWWYIEAQPDPYRLRVEPGDTVQVKIQGMPWEGGWFRRRRVERSVSVSDLQYAPLREEETPERGGSAG